MTEKFKIQQAYSSGSAIEKYRALVFGQRGLFRLLGFELVMLLCAKRSGALGLFLRKHAYRWILGSVGRNVVFGTSITLRHPHKIHIGDNVIVDDYVSLDAKGKGNRGIELKDGVFIGRHSILSCKDGDITMDENANLGFNCTISSTNKVQVGKDNIIAAYTYLLGGGSYEFDDVSTPIRENYDYTGKGGVSTGENVWIGAHVTVLDGVSIGSGCVVGAGSVVSHSIESDSVAAGTPAKVLRKRRTTDSG